MVSKNIVQHCYLQASTFTPTHVTDTETVSSLRRLPTFPSALLPPAEDEAEDEPDLETTGPAGVAEVDGEVNNAAVKLANANIPPTTTK